MVSPFIRVAAKILGLGLAVLVAGCHKASTPETEVRQLVEQAQHAAEARSVSDLAGLLSADFRDAQGNSSDDVARYLRAYFIANQSVRLITRIDSLQFPAPDTADLKVGVASATQSNGESGLGGIGADFKTFDLTLIKEGDNWKVRHAKWQ
jgi:hypothetical protein